MISATPLQESAPIKVSEVRRVEINSSLGHWLGSADEAVHFIGRVLSHGLAGYAYLNDECGWLMLSYNRDHVFLCATFDATTDEAGHLALSRDRRSEGAPVEFVLENGQVDEHPAELTISRQQALSAVAAWTSGSFSADVDWQ